MRIDTPADACAALAALMVGADEVGTLEEGRFLFETVATLPIFNGLDQAQFASLMADTTESVWAVASDGRRITDEGVSELVGLIRDALPPELRAEAFRTAARLAQSDGVSTEEEHLLDRLSDGLGIDPALAKELRGPHL